MARAPSDVLRAVVAVAALLVTVVVGWLFDDALVGFAADLLRGLDALPVWFVTLVVAAGQALALVLGVAALVVAVRRRSWFLLGSAAVASVAAVVLVALLRPLADDTEGALTRPDESYTLLAPDEVPSAAALAALAAVVTVTSPWVARRWRRAGWALVLLATVVRFVGAPVSFDTLLAVLAGWAAGAVTVAALGAPSRRPTRDAIARGLAAVGVSLAELEPAAVDARGSTPYFGATVDGTRLFVKTLGDDERSADLLFRLYRRVQPADLGDERPFSTLRRAVEHEALVAMAAGAAGVRTPRLVAFAAAEPNGFTLAYEAVAGRSLDRVDPGELTDEVLREVWRQLSLLRTHGIAHRDLRLANVFLADDGEAWLIDFGFSEMAADDRLLANDVAELLASSATKVGTERALAVGAVVGDDALRSAADRLRPAMLSGATRTALAEAPGTLEQLRERLAALPPSATSSS
jgi:undecaprenyl-diphosphatase